MRRFDYVCYITPDDPKKQRQRITNKLRSKATTLRGVALALVGHDFPELQNIPDTQLSTDPAQNQFEFEYSSKQPASKRVFVEIHQVEESCVHPLTQDGFVSWAQDRVRKNPVVENRPNSIDLELATVLHQFQMDQLCDEKASDLREWLSDIFWSGHKGYRELTREELLQKIDEDIIENFDEEGTTVEDVVRSE